MSAPPIEPHLHWPLIPQAAVAAVQDALERSRLDNAVLNGLAGGGPIAELEQALGHYLSLPHVLAVNSGAAALHLALLAAGVGPGDEVIVPTYGWGQVLTFLDALDAVPVFADLDPATLCVHPASVAARLTERTRAVVVVHQSGHPADVDAVTVLAHDAGAVVIEDCAQALGARFADGRLVGSAGDLSVFSFGPRKHLPLGEGGALATHDRWRFETAIVAGQHPDRAALQVHRHGAGELFWPYRMHPLAAVLGMAMLDCLPAWHQQRVANVQRVLEALSQLTAVAVPRRVPVADHAWCHLPLTVLGTSDPAGRAALLNWLRSLNVPVSLGLVGQPLHRRHEVVARWGQQSPCALAEERCAAQELVLVDAVAWVEDNQPTVDRLLQALTQAVQGQSQPTVA